MTGPKRAVKGTIEQQLPVRMSDELYRKGQAKAAKLGVSFAEWVRQLIARALK